MFKIIIHVFQMDINCILMNIILMFMIIIHVFQKDFICILMKYYFNVIKCPFEIHELWS